MKNELNHLYIDGNMVEHEDRWALAFLKLSPTRLTLLNKYKFQLRLLRVTNYYRFVRQFLGYPSRGQRTWSNAQSARRLNKYVRQWRTEQHFSQFKFSCPPTTMYQVMRLEFFNEMWYTQWHHEWKYAKEYRLKNTRLFRYKKWKFGITYALKNRALTYYQNPYKLKRMKGKKKLVLPKNQFNVGFDLNFTTAFYKKLFNPTFWKRRKTMVL